MKHQVIKWLNAFSVVFLIAALAIAVAALPLTQQAFAAWDGSAAASFASGSGSESNPYVIKTEQQLGYFLTQLNAGVTYEGLYIRLDSDLDMTGGTWTPGTFAGTFDGYGHIVTADCLFLKTLSETGTVKRLVYAVETVLSSTVFVDTNRGLIESCVAYGTVKSSGTAGVLCDDNYGDIRNCGCIGASTGNHAGMVAYFHTGTIEHCYSAVSVITTGGGEYSASYGGPLYARTDYDTEISDSYYNSTLYKASCTQGGGLSTEEMTSEAFTETMNSSLFSGCYWVHSDEDGLFEGYPLPVPCYDASTTLTYTDEKVAVYHTDSLSTKLSASDSGTIYYTLDGTNPITSSTRKTYSANSSLTLSGDVTVRSVVCYNGEYSAVNTQKLIQLLGAGTESDPHRIYNKSQLDALRLDTTASYLLMNDLEFTEDDYAADGVAPNGWTPFPAFSGTFDGGTHAIYGLRGSLGGLFDSNSGTIENLRIVDHRFFDDYCYGAVANGNSGSILRCYTKSAYTKADLPSPATKQISMRAGGIAGSNSGTVKYCRNDGLVYATSIYPYNWLYAGGIVGAGNADSCYNTGLVLVRSTDTTEYAYAGGISPSGSQFYNCRNDGAISMHTALDYDQYLGGISTGVTSSAWSYSCVVGYGDISYGAGSGRTHHYTYSSNPDNCYRLSDRLHTSEYPELDFETEWMLTEEGPVPQGVMNADGSCPTLYSMQREATCTDTGLLYYQDAISNSVDSWTVPALGHKYNAWTAVDGADIHAHACTVSGCGHMEFETHTWEVDQEVAPTCTADGYGDYSCACGAEKSVTDTGSALGHSFTEYVSDGNAACTADGTKTALCDNGCGETDTLADPGSALGHSFTAYISDGNATCTADGTETALCDNGCGAQDTRTAENSRVDHLFDRYYVNNDATCTQEGTATAACAFGCGETHTVFIDNSELPHSFTAYTFNNDATCSENGTETARCDYGCGTQDTRTAENSRVDHLFDRYYVNNDATCTQEGTATASCAFGCGVTRTVFVENSKLPHTWSDVDADFIRICKVCDTTEQCDTVSGVTENDLAWTLTYEGHLTVSGTGYLEADNGWALYSDRIVSVTLDSGIAGAEPEVFDSLPNMAALHLGDTVTDLEYDEWASNCPMLSRITVADGNPAFSATDGILYNARQTKLLVYPPAKADTVYVMPATVTGIAASAFDGCGNLVSITLSDNLQPVSNGTFSDCTGLQSIYISKDNPYFTCDDVALIQNKGNVLLRYCVANPRTDYTVPDGVKTIADGAFARGSNLKTMRLPISLTSVERGAFDECGALQTVSYPGTENYWATVDVEKWNEELLDALVFGTVDSMSGTCGDDLVWTLSLSDGNLTVTGTGAMTSAPWNRDMVESVELGFGVTSICDEAFAECGNLSSVDIPDSVTSIGTDAFFRSGLETVTVPDSVTYLGESAFDYCLELSSAVIGSGVTTIIDNTFENCKALTEVTIPKSVTVIGDDAFAYCPLETVYYTGSEPRWGLVSIASGNTALYTARMVFDSYLVVEWNSAHTVLSISGQVEDAAYVTAAFYNEAQQMALVKHYAAAQVRTGVGISSDTADLTRCTAKVMVLDGNYAPVGVAYTPDAEKEIPEDTDYRDLLVLLLDVDDAYSTGTIRETNAIEYMTLDGETFIAAYADGTAGCVPFEELLDMDPDAPEGRLFLLRQSTKGRVALERPVSNEIIDQLDVDDTVVNGYEEGSGYCIDATGAAAKVDSYRVDGDAPFFVATETKGKFTYEVLIGDDLEGLFEDAYVQMLTLENAKGTRTTVVGGYLCLPETPPAVTAGSGYLSVSELGKTSVDGTTVELTFDDGVTKSVLLEASQASLLAENLLYAYTYDAKEDLYTFTQVEMPVQTGEIWDFDDDNILWFTDGVDAELDNEVIAIVNITVDVGENAGEFSLTAKSLEFVPLKDLSCSMIEDDYTDKTYSQYTDYLLDAGELFYVASFHIMDTTGADQDRLADSLDVLFDTLLSGEDTFRFAS